MLPKRKPDPDWELIHNLFLLGLCAWMTWDPRPWGWSMASGWVMGWFTRRIIQHWRRR